MKIDDISDRVYLEYGWKYFLQPSMSHYFVAMIEMGAKKRRRFVYVLRKTDVIVGLASKDQYNRFSRRS
jgi:hypothetical protein